MGFKLCHRMWCGRCYSSDVNYPFHIADLGDANGEGDDKDRITSGWKSRRCDALRYQAVWNGGDLMVSFECNVCVFSKLYNRLPFTDVNNEKDAFAMAYICRIIFDTFWSRAQSTVMLNAHLMRSVMKESFERGWVS